MSSKSILVTICLMMLRPLFGQDYSMTECLPVQFGEDSLCFVYYDYDYPDVHYVFCLNQNYYPADFVKDTTWITFSVTIMFKAEPNNHHAHISFERIDAYLIKIENGLHRRQKLGFDEKEIYLHEFQNIAQTIQYCYYIDSPNIYKEYERKCTIYMPIQFVPVN